MGSVAKQLAQIPLRAILSRALEGTTLPGKLVLIHYSPLESRFSYLQKSFPPIEQATVVTESVALEPDESIFELDRCLYGVDVETLENLHFEHVLRIFFPTRLATVFGRLLPTWRRISPPLSRKIRRQFEKAAITGTAVDEVRRMHVAAISCAANEPVHGFTLVMEDDSLLCPNFVTSWQHLLTADPEQVHWVSLSSSPLQDSIRGQRGGRNLGGTSLIREKSYLTPNAYLISNSFARSLLCLFRTHGISKSYLIDFTYLTAALSLKPKIYRAFPPLVEQGSDLGFFDSGFDYLMTID